MPLATDCLWSQLLSFGVAWGFCHFSEGPWQTSQETPFWTDHLAPSTTLAASTTFEWQVRHLGLVETLAMAIAVPMAFEGALYSVVKALAWGSEAFQIVYSLRPGEPLAASAPWQSFVLHPAIPAYLNLSWAGRAGAGIATAATPSAAPRSMPIEAAGTRKFFIGGSFYRRDTRNQESGAGNHEYWN